MRRVVALAAVVVVALLVESSVLGGLRLGGARPDLLVLAVVAVAMASGPVPGASFGFWAGLAADLLLDLPAGVTAFAYTLTGFGVGLVRVYVVGTNLAAHLVLAAVASLAATWLEGVVLRLLDLSAWAAVLRSGPLVAACNLLVAPLVYPPVRAVAERVLAERAYRW